MAWQQNAMAWQQNAMAWQQNAMLFIALNCGAGHEESGLQSQN
jgi:hypothetical protein